MTDIESEASEYLYQSFTVLNLSGKEVYSKEFDSCTFKECDFTNALLNQCKFIDCHFVKCNLSVVSIKGSKFLEVDFDDCKVIGVDWTKACWPSLELSSSIKFHKCIVNDSSFSGLSMSELVLEECKAHDVDFRGGNFSEGNFTYTDLSNSLFGKTNLTGANFAEAINFTIDVYKNEIKRAKFCRYEAMSLLEGLGVELMD